MEKQIEVIVGTGIGGQRNIMEAIRSEGFQVRSAGNGRQWPRDHYVYFNGKYVKSGSPGFIDGNAFGEGGNILTGEGFLLVSDMAHIKEKIAKSLPNKPNYEQIKEAIEAEGKVCHPDTRIHVAPTGYFHGGKGHSHIDMFSLLLPNRKALVIDTHFGKGAARAKEYDTIAEAERLRLIKYDGSQDGVWYPLNSLVLQKGSSDIVFVDSKAVSLMRLLEQEGVKSIGIDMPQHEYPAGKINCQTNTYNSGDNIEGLLEEF